MPTVQISTTTFGSVSEEPLRLLERAGIDYRLNPHQRRLEPPETIGLLADCDGVIAGTERLDRDVLSKLPNLAIISRCGTGLENVDLAAARELGIVVRNTPDALTDAVAELALGGILALLRSVARADRDLRAGQWKKRMGRLLRGKTVGIVGLGRIGRALALLLGPFDVTLLATDLAPDRAFTEKHGIEVLPLEELLRGADVVSLHTPLSDETHHLLDREMLSCLREGAVLINCSRGGLLDESALYDLLENGRLGGAYLDTFEREPYEGPLRDLPNVLLTPHIGSYAAESRLLMESQSVRNLIQFFDDEGRP